MNDERRTLDASGKVAERWLVELRTRGSGGQRLRRCLHRPADAVLDLLRGMGIVEDVREEVLQEVFVVLQPVMTVELRRPLVRGRCSSNAAMAASRENGCPNVTAGPMKTTPSTRSGCSAASRSARWAAADQPTMYALSVPVASSTATASAANSVSLYAAGPVGLSDRPLPRPSKVMTRQWRERYGICSFQQREWTMDHVGSKRMVGVPVPYTS